MGRRLYDVLLPLLARQGYRSAYAGISQPNPDSVGLHERLGYQHIGTYPKVGYKLGQWHDVGYWHLELEARTCPPSEIRPYSQITDCASALGCVLNRSTQQD
ncbi:GNAT family N-acetyltransferase [Pseudomonas vancouverensis]|uniref:GNAT family N-acetyltransferase n=1 Tax=Pseudomonas vancouverensis TaxID=95300 RepID=A0A4R4JQY5_PSEVA|nr:GNAT family N-acetyltransferase [Pseudomonas vancouverensis]TDB56950.1 GNAT family N-acetyltransferase [Pseudomonas vancouverensis]